jgi:hypothetical protein
MLAAAAAARAARVALERQLQVAMVALVQAATLRAPLFSMPVVAVELSTTHLQEQGRADLAAVVQVVLTQRAQAVPQTLAAAAVAAVATLTKLHKVVRVVPEL